MSTIKVERIDANRWRIPRSGDMQVDGLVYASARMMDEIRRDQSLQQVANVAHLPGIVGASLAMPDIHWGYGFPIGGVAATDPETGVISPGGVGYDINCGVRLLASELELGDVRPKVRELVRGGQLTWSEARAPASSVSMKRISMGSAGVPVSSVSRRPANSMSEPLSEENA